VSSPLPSGPGSAPLGATDSSPSSSGQKEGEREKNNTEGVRRVCTETGEESVEGRGNQKKETELTNLQCPTGVAQHKLNFLR